MTDLTRPEAASTQAPDPAAEPPTEPNQQAEPVPPTTPPPSRDPERRAPTWFAAIVGVVLLVAVAGVGFAAGRATAPVDPAAASDTQSQARHDGAGDHHSHAGGGRGLPGQSDGQSRGDASGRRGSERGTGDPGGGRDS